MFRKAKIDTIRVLPQISIEIKEVLTMEVKSMRVLDLSENDT